MTENAQMPAIHVTYTFTPQLGWEGTHDVSEDAPAWATVHSLTANGELNLNKSIDQPSQLRDWAETREAIIRLTRDFVDLAHARAGHVVEYVTHYYRAPPFDERDVWRYQRELLGLDRPPALASLKRPAELTRKAYGEIQL